MQPSYKYTPVPRWLDMMVSTLVNIYRWIQNKIIKGCSKVLKKLIVFYCSQTSFGMYSAMSGLGEGERHSPSYLMRCPSNKYLCDQMLSELLDNRLLIEALRYYFPSGEPSLRPSAPTPKSTLSCASCAQQTSRSVNAYYDAQ